MSATPQNHNHLTPTRRDRLNRWLQLPPEIIKQLPPNEQAYIFAAVAEEGKHQLAQSRTAEFKAICDRRLPRDREHLSTFIVTLAGALTFSLAPQLIASQSGRGLFSISIGFVGGGAASFYAHANATKVLSGQKLQEMTKQARKAIDPQ